MSDIPQELSDIGKGIWLLKNSIRCLPLLNDYQNARLREETTVQKLTQLLEESEAYRAELVAELRGALREAVGRLEMKCCLQLIEAIEWMHGGAPDYKQFIFGALQELEQLLVLVEMEGDKPITPDDAFARHHDSYPEDASRRLIAKDWFDMQTGEERSRMVNVHGSQKKAIDNIITSKVKNYRSKRKSP